MSIENLVFPGGGRRAQLFEGLVPAAYGSGQPNQTAYGFAGPNQPVKVSNNDYIQGADNLTENERETIRKRYLDAEYTPKQDLSQFEALLGKLEGSKMKQADQANRARRGDIYSQGIAQMMRNF